MTSRIRRLGTTTGITQCIMVTLSTPAFAWQPSKIPPLPAHSHSARSAIRETDKKLPIPSSPEPVETRLTKNWGGDRSFLSNQGVDLAVIYKFEVNSTLSGGTQQGTVTLGNLDLRLGFDFEKMGFGKGTSAFFYVLGNHGGNPTDFAGDSQGSSNIQTPISTTKIYEGWIQQLLFDGKLSILAGLHDLNSEFYVTEASTLYLNSSLGIGTELAQTGAHGPSIFPSAAPAIRVRTEPSANFYLQAAAFGAVASDPEQPGTHVSLRAVDGLLLISELAWLRGAEENSKLLPGKYAVGYWNYSKPVDHLTAQTGVDGAGDPIMEKAVNGGIYLLAEQSLSESITLFGRYGFANPEVNEFSSALGAGVTFTGLLPSRDQDRFGFAIAKAWYGKEFKQTADGAGKLSAETSIEVTYHAELIRGISLQPDFQYIMHPSGDPALKNASVGSVRVEVSF